MRAFLALVSAAVFVLSGCAPPPGSENGSFDLERDGRTIHYEVYGRGPVVMTLPNSWGLGLEGLRALYRPLEERVTMVYFDPRGIGGSGAVREESDRGLAAVREDFHSLRRHLGLQKVHAIGWSNGAVNLIELAAESPETLESAIFVHGMHAFTEEDVSAAEERYPDLVADYRELQKTLHGPELSDDEKTVLMKAFWLERWFPTTSADPEGVRPAIDGAFGGVEFSWLHARYAQEDLALFDFTDKLASAGVRSLVIAGAHDMLPPARAEAMHEALPDSEYVLFEQSGHFAPLEEPERFRETVFAFLGV